MKILIDNETAAVPGLELRGIQKAYGSNLVLRGIDLEFASGMVHALLGANGAGKSTLLGCLSGATRPDQGDIIIHGVSYAGFTPTHAFAAGTSIIYQHFQLIGSLSVSDNIFLGEELRGPLGLANRRQQDQEAESILQSLSVSIKPTTLVSSLSVGEQQIVEIARALRRRPKILILDEPTAALGVDEVDSLLELIKRLARSQGITVIYVTHLLDEVLKVADTVTVLRDGHVYWSRATAGLTIQSLATAISPDGAVRHKAKSAVYGNCVLRMSELRCSYTGPVNLSVHEGEIVALFGPLGSGRTNLLETLAGVIPRQSGDVAVNGTLVNSSSPRKANLHGISLVASDRKIQSLFGSLTAEENVLLPHYGKTSKVLRKRAVERTQFAKIADDVNLTPRDGQLVADAFSGGNAQKLVLGRWAGQLSTTEVLLLDEPTQGIDIGSRLEVYDLLRKFAGQPGRCVLFASSDVEEVLALADRVVILNGGQPVEIDATNASESTLLSAAHGDLTLSGKAAT